MLRTLTLLTAAACVLVSTGCQATFSEDAQYGVTFYCPGAGNFDGGQIGVKQGLRAAGYRGDVYPILWTFTFNPAVDQFFKRNAHWGGERLARTIEDYMDQYPGRPVTIVGLSAGTGVALFACEELKRGYKVDNVVLLSSSLSCDYDISRALRAIKGTIYNFYSDRDIVLAGPMKVAGTIDGKWGKDGAGAVGLTPPTGRDRVVNIRWKPEFTQYGNFGAHMDPTNASFVEAVIAKYIVIPDDELARRIIRAVLALKQAEREAAAAQEAVGEPAAEPAPVRDDPQARLREAGRQAQVVLATRRRALASAK